MRPRGLVQVWRVRLGGADRAADEALLSAGEKARAARFRAAGDAARFIACRAALRRVLGAHGGAAPGALEIAAEAGGKPRLADPRLAWLRFNVSHARDEALIVVARDRRVGIDLEAVSADGMRGLPLAQVMSAAEREEWGALPEARRVRAFFGLWVAKEAYVKACGDGLARPLAAITAGWRRSARGRRVRDEAHPGDARTFRIFPVEAPEGFLGAVAIEDPEGEARVSVGDWPAAGAAPA